MSVTHKGKDCILNIARQEEGRIRMSLTEFYKKLDENVFIKLDRCCVINLAYASHIEKRQLVLDDGTRYPIPRGKIRELGSKIEEYQRKNLEMSISRT